jgi:hypothetical protein
LIFAMLLDVRSLPPEVKLLVAGSERRWVLITR